MSGDIVARRYAGALFAIGREKGLGELEKYGSTLTALEKLLKASPDLERLLRAPVITPAEKEAVLGALLEKLGANPIMVSFLHLLAEKSRLDQLAAIAAAFERLLDEAKGIVRGTVVTAVPLGAAKKGELAASLGKKAGSEVELGFEVDPGILGGIVLRLGNTIMDASLRAQLTALIDTIKRGE